MLPQQCDERGVAGAVGMAAWRCGCPRARRSPTPLKLDFTGAGPCPRAAGAGRGRVADPGRERRRRRLPQCRVRNRAGRECASWSMCACRRAPAMPCRWKKSPCRIARDAPLSRAFRQLRQQAVAHGIGDRAGRRGRGGASLRRGGAGRQAPQRRHHPCHPSQSATPTAPSCSSMSRAARPRRLSGQGDGGQGRRRQRQPPDRQGAAAGRRRRKPISSRNWKSSPTTSNAPMARRSAIWMRIRCSICAPAAFRKPRRAACCCTPSWKTPWRRSPIPTSASWCAPNC